jgi:ATP-binding cassette subfamily B (MDR/TAP) protein 1
VREGDFYSLMFFIVALGNLAVYAAIGWASNIVAQVRVLELKVWVIVINIDKARLAKVPT